ncbi:nickel-responsive regulator 1 [Candidatus Micrarchaeota archaeon CG08_land_8_20_14_0_20_49_17]|nr:MAG: nickel-responsive regulator 1 [Candidatus Micrarchaeota archaeon CG08_land_8_20_14_0_20_49_17]PIZ92096.1 MAG: nickel-responsive regulator 1 [Candidatus Micrarchaeota archaeon CG_4_10_14_0_2_um_filter_49_7]HII54132.1 CopG family ribbon-helix-helix protein [Candidatus Micrarchaeota archaeon]
MSNIISISLNEKMLKELDRLRTEMGFSSRSEIIRSALRFMAQETQRKAHPGEAIYIIVYSDSPSFGKVVHGFKRLISAHLHSHLNSGKCMELIIAKGDGKQLSLLAKALLSCKGMEYSKFIYL